MSQIVAGLFEEQVSAERAMETLRARGIDGPQMTTFFVSPPGMHHELPLGGDEPADPQARGGEKGAAKGAALGSAAGIAAGALAAPLVGPVAIAAGIGVGAYIGSLAGATKQMGDQSEAEDRPTARPGGVMVAVNVDQIPKDDVVTTLEQAGATLVELAEGQWRDGDWIDFDPVHPPRNVVSSRRNPNYPT